MELGAIPTQVMRLGRVAKRGGLLTARPDRLARAGVVLRRFGPTLAGASGAAAILHPDRPGIIDEDRTITFADLDARSNALAHALEEIGVARGTTVGLLARNHHGFVESTIALAKLGAHIVMLNTSMAGPQLREACANEGVTVVIHDDEFTDLFPDADLQLVATSTLDDTIDKHSTAPLAPPEKHGRIVILTSGTTGTPKGARRPAVPPAASTLGTLDSIPYQSGEPMVIAAPMFHSWGFAHLTIALAVGDTMVLQARFDPEATVAAIAQHRARVLAAVPVMLRRILDVPSDKRAKYDTSSLRLVPLSGSAIPAGLAEEFMDAFGDVIYNLYGSTEAGAVTVATPSDLRSAPGTAGRPPAGVELRILGPDGAAARQGATGSIAVRSALVFDGYTGGDNKPFVDGFMRTGDTGHLDADGRLFVDGRDDEMIVSGGEKVYPREVEDLLSKHAAIHEAAVIGVPDDEFGHRLRAFVVLAPGTDAAALDEDAVRDHVRTHLARYKVPRDVVFLPELPRNATGKVLKRELH
jgi:fatty-acyl-CoA synthase